jgi:hypothetical protein
MTTNNSGWYSSSRNYFAGASSSIEARGQGIVLRTAAQSVCSYNLNWARRADPIIHLLGVLSLWISTLYIGIVLASYFFNESFSPSSRQYIRSYVWPSKTVTIPEVGLSNPRSFILNPMHSLRVSVDLCGWYSFN